ncbi:MAG: PQQ-dependent sugar dehydrogenase [Pseudomonadota bacterium]
MRNRPLLILLLGLSLSACESAQHQALKAYMSVSKGLVVADGVQTVQSEAQDFDIVALTEELDFPWGMAFLPNAEVLITEKPGRLLQFNLRTGTSVQIEGVPTVFHKGQGGLLDVVLHPDFAENQWLYLSMAVPADDGESTTEVHRFRLDGQSLTDSIPIFRAEPAMDSSTHFGCALLFGNDGYLYITMGDRRQRYLAQDLEAYPGKVFRLKDDGGIPADNPFLEIPGALPGIYTYGHRNPQGITIDRSTGRIWTSEHGPQGGDEINELVAGANYGWPVITYGEEYGGGEIGEGTEKTGMEQPLLYYVPSIATAGIAYYDGANLPSWRGDLFVTGLRSFSLSRISFDRRGEARDERLLEGFGFRLRDVAQGPDGNLYLLTENGGLLRLSAPTGRG